MVIATLDNDPTIFQDEIDGQKTTDFFYLKLRFLTTGGNQRSTTVRHDTYEIKPLLRILGGLEGRI